MYLVCVSRGFWWQDSEKYALTSVWHLSVLAVYLVEQQLPLSLSLSLSIYIYVYISRIQHNAHRNERVFDGTSYCMKPEKMWNKRSRWSSTWNEYTVWYRLILITLTVPVCKVLSDYLCLVLYSKCMYETLLLVHRRYTQCNPCFMTYFLNNGTRAI